MIKLDEFRPGNFLLEKTGVRVLISTCNARHYSMSPSDNAKNLFPVVLNADVFSKAGFIENKDYALLPEAREFRLVLPVKTGNVTEIMGYIKNNKEAFARAQVSNQIASNPVYHLHQLQNLFYALTGEEMVYKI